MKKHQTTIHLDEKDRQAVASIKEHYGLNSDVAAIRMALRELERTVQQASQPGAYRPPDGAVTPHKERASYPPG